MEGGTNVKTAELISAPNQQPMHLELEQKQQHSQRKPVKKIHYPFWFGGSASCFAAAVTHPLDLGTMAFFSSSLTATFVKYERLIGNFLVKVKISFPTHPALRVD